MKRNIVLLGLKNRILYVVQGICFFAGVTQFEGCDHAIDGKQLGTTLRRNLCIRKRKYKPVVPLFVTV